MKRGVILFAHGSRDPLWRLPMEKVAELTRQLDPAVEVACAYLELTEPDLSVASTKMLSQGVQHITIVPMFLGVGKHAREDLPQLVGALEAAEPQVRFVLKPAVSEDARLLDLLAKMALETPD